MKELISFTEILILLLIAMLSGCVIAGSDVPIFSNPSKIIVSTVVPTAEVQIKSEQTASDKILDINVKGYSDNIVDGEARDKREAEIYAKRAACERAGVNLKSITRIKDLQVEDDLIESKCHAQLLQGYTFEDIGYTQNGSYAVVLIGKIRLEQEQ